MVFVNLDNAEDCTLLILDQSLNEDDDSELAISEDTVNSLFGESTDQEVSDENDSDTEPPEQPPGGKKGLGRQRDPIWKNFIQSPEFPSEWVCKHCTYKIRRPKADRLRNHIQSKCKNANPGRKRRANSSSAVAAVSVPIGSIGSGPSASAESASEGEKDISFLLEKPAKQRKIDAYFSSTSAKEKERLDQLLVKFICSANVPFALVENKEFRDFVAALRPNYELPSAKQLSNKLLDDLYNASFEKVKSALNGKRVTVMQDGWTSPQHEAVIAHSVSCNDKVYFIDAISAEEEKKSAKNCKQWLESCINKISEQFGATTVACITDNCNTMEATRSLLKKDLPNILTYGCNSHLFNLTGKKRTPEDLKIQIVQVQKYFRNHDFASACLKKLNGLRPVVPGDTRWNSQLDCFRCYVANQAKYLEISRKDEKIPAEIKSTLENPKTFENLTSALAVLEPIGKSLDTVSRNRILFKKTKQVLTQIFSFGTNTVVFSASKK